ncbi:Macrolide export ATP-binding/permease protein MacB [Collinsella sp. AK_207A]|uniref:ABC transporter ATP-binding protein/permease n=1 Tax=Collinsella sp. AK_207A TaxID=2650472 RepID=UPI0012604363|nr:ABC transporter ATP-binding protein/permease [Collinsella sp. AK_207A]VWL92665.1 Macrolide export ATP-binding/permease protein MacB [Collinsella sp. AK_207A]
MLELKGITKDYPSGDTVVHALKGISVAFRDQEFVSILGQSGCGKTTLLNIIGGLDHYTRGDLIINGRSTKSYQDRDWDTYRNHSVGFVFQSYNLIPHQSVIANVEMALLLSGAPRADRRARAAAALAQVGLAEQMHKRPNQLSGGQMQRVAIARAIVNDPEIILADEPTGALDTETSVEVMEILKRLSRDRLVIMVTHNPQLAEEYSDRIVRIRDGEVTSDSRPVDAEAESLTPEQIQEHAVADARKGKRGMSYLSAIQLSFNNLMTKKGRTFLTAFAGSIGIIGIALILSLSDGAQNYIAETEETTMGSYPLTIQKTAVDMASMMSAMMGTGDTKGEAPKGTAESKNIVTDMVESIGGGATENDMKAIKQWLETNPGDISDLVTDIQYNYSTPLNVFKDDTSAGAVQVNPATVMNALGISTSGSTQTQLMSSMASTGQGYDVWSELLSSKKAVDRDWKLVDGRMPQAWNEVVIALDEHGRISDYTLYALGMLDQSDLKGMMRNVLAGKKVEGAKETSYSYDELMKLVFRLVPESSKYQKQADGTWKDMSEDAAFMKSAVAAGEQVHVVGVVRATGDAGATVARYGGVLYPASLMKHMVETVAASDVVAAQKADPGTDIFTGYPFSDTASATMSLDEIESMIGMMGGEQATQAQAYIDQMRAQGSSDEEIAAAFSKLMSSQTDDATYDGNLEKLGAASLDDPSVIQIYPVDFKAKEQIDTLIDDYNKDIKAAGEGSEIQYTDIVGTLMSSVTSIVNSLTYILIAFVAISLVVSSIMIGIITYISVLERTKEIGILRAIGASKRDVSRIFTAETFITGLVSGLLGVGITVLLDFPVNWIIEAVAGVRNLAAVPAGAGAVLVLISVALALAAGLAPSRMAAKKDPVTALRTE